MGNYQEEAMGIVKELEEKAKEMKNLEELEQLIIEYERRFSQHAFEELSEEVTEGVSPPSKSVSWVWEEAEP